MAFKFITKEELLSGATEEKKKDQVLTWDLLKEHEIFGVTNIEKTQHKEYGTGYIFHLVDEQNRTCKVWAPRRVATKILTERQPHHNAFVASLGIERIDRQKTRYLYDVTFKYDINAVDDLVI